MRYYANVSFLGFNEFGLVDTGANISCVGSNLATYDFSAFPNFRKCKSFVKTADGTPQAVTGWLDVDLTFKNKTEKIKFFIIPSISQRVILGIDFCKTFKLIFDVIVSTDIFTLNESNRVTELYGFHEKL